MQSTDRRRPPSDTGHKPVPRPETPVPPTDRRVRRTREMLRAALLSLMQEKRYDEITVTDILDRAGIGRSTFYAHYRDKDALLLSGFDDIRAALAAERERAAASDADPLEPLLAVVRHVEAYREVARRIIRIDGNLPHVIVGGLPELTEALVREGLRRRMPPDPVAAEAATQFLSGALVSLLTWWTSYDVSLTPDELYDVFRRLAADGLGSFLRPVQVT